MYPPRPGVKITWRTESLDYEPRCRALGLRVRAGRVRPEEIVTEFLATLVADDTGV